MLFVSETSKERRDLLEFVNEVLPDANAADAAAAAEARLSVGDGDDDGDGMDEPALPSYEHYNLADMLRRRWAIHIRQMLTTAAASPTPPSGCSGGTVSDANFSQLPTYEHTFV